MPQVDRDTRRPRIMRVGQAMRLSTGTLVVRGWSIAPCLSMCECHTHPQLGVPVIVQDAGRGLVGLRSFVPGECGCCQPWTAEELEAVIRDFRAIAALAASFPAKGG